MEENDKIYFCFSDRGFYVESVHGDNIPLDKDIIQISFKEYNDLIKGQSDGKLIIKGSDGRPGLGEQYNGPYNHRRMGEYPPIGDQLDDLYHRGFFSDEMTAKIKAVKDKHPKGT